MSNSTSFALSYLSASVENLERAPLKGMIPAARKLGDCQKLEILMRTLSFWSSVGVWPFTAPRNGGRDDATGILIIWGTSVHHILQIDSLHQLPRALLPTSLIGAAGPWNNNLRYSKTSSLGQSARLSITKSSPGSIPAKPQKKTRTQVYMDLNYIDPQARILNVCFVKVSINQSPCFTVLGPIVWSLLVFGFWFVVPPHS